MERRGKIGLAIGAGMMAAAAALVLASGHVRTKDTPTGNAIAGEARQGGLTLTLPEALAHVRRGRSALVDICVSSPRSLERMPVE